MQEQIGRGRARRDRIHGDAAAAQFLGQDRGQGFDRRLGRDIDAVSLEPGADDAGREIDDASAVAQPARRLAHGVEAALQIDRDLLVEGRVIGVGDLAELHDAGIVDQHVDAAERRFRCVEHAAHGTGIADIGLRGQRAAAGGLDPVGDRLGRLGIAGIVDDDGEAVPGEPLGHCRTDPARSARYQSYLVGLLSHFETPIKSAAEPRSMGGRYALAFTG